MKRNSRKKQKREREREIVKQSFQYIKKFFELCIIFINISDHVEGTTLCTQASKSYSLPGKLLTKCCIINNKNPKGSFC